MRARIADALNPRRRDTIRVTMWFFRSPTIVYGEDALQHLAEVRGRRALIITDPNVRQAGLIEPVLSQLAQAGLQDSEGIQRAVAGVEAIVHTACVMGRPPSMDKQTYYDINTTGTFRLLEAAADQSERLHRFIHISSDTVYPMPALLYAPVDEQHPRLPVKEYGLIKVLNEELVRHYTREFGLKTVIIRPGAILAGEEIFQGWTGGGLAHGQYQESAKAQRGPLYHPEMPENLARLQEAVKQTGEDPTRLLVNFHDREGRPWVWQRTDARDVVHGILCALEADAAIGETFNMHVPYAIPFSEATRVLSDVLKLRVLDWEAPACWQYWADNSKAKALVGYRPQHDFHRMVDDALALRAGKQVDIIPA